MLIKKLDEIVCLAKSKQKKRLVAVFANDSHTIEAAYKAVEEGIVEATLTGEREKIAKACNELQIDIAKFEILEFSNAVEAGFCSIDLIQQGKAQLIMKGTISTDDFMRCILNKERGLLEPGSLLSHVTVIEPTGYHKLLIVGDVAVIPAPNVEQKEKILHFLIDTAHKLGNEEPLVALIGPSEKPSPKIPSSADATELVARAERGVFQKSIIAGPMGFDLAIDPESVEIKGYKSPVGGNADIILFPNIEAGNVFYKTATKFLKAELGAIVVGCKVPVILSSRGDSTMTKLYSIALAAVTVNDK